MFGPLLLAQQTPPDDISFTMLFLQMILVLAIVLVLIWVVLRKILPLFVPNVGHSSQTVHILERLPIDQKKSLLVVQVDERVFLLGSAEGQINVLMELDAEKIAANRKPAQVSGLLDSFAKKMLFKTKPRTG
jgi:flagellar protein FliO/FliZ